MLRNGLEPWHLLIVALVVVLLFGSRKLPDTARALGKSLRILKSETRAMRTEDSKESKDTAVAASPVPSSTTTEAAPPVPGEARAAAPGAGAVTG